MRMHQRFALTYFTCCKSGRANKQMQRTAVPRCSFESAGVFGHWIRRQRPFPAAVGDPGCWAESR
jgi:hypothetical protein